MMRMIIQTKSKAGKCPAAAHTANVAGIVDDDFHDPDSELEDDTTDANPMTSTSEKRQQQYFLRWCVKR